MYSSELSTQTISKHTACSSALSNFLSTSWAKSDEQEGLRVTLSTVTVHAFSGAFVKL